MFVMGRIIKAIVPGAWEGVENHDSAEYEDVIVSGINLIILFALPKFKNIFTYINYFLTYSCYSYW